jgi:hypothetical protein
MTDLERLTTESDALSAAEKAQLAQHLQDTKTQAGSANFPQVRSLQ